MITIYRNYLYNCLVDCSITYPDTWDELYTVCVQR